MPLSGRDHFVVDGNQHCLVQISAAKGRMAAKCFRHITPAPNLLEHCACEFFFIGCEQVRCAPAFLSFGLHGLSFHRRSSTHNLAKVANLRKVLFNL